MLLNLIFNSPLEQFQIYIFSMTILTFKPFNILIIKLLILYLLLIILFKFNLIFLFKNKFYIFLLNFLNLIENVLNENLFLFRKSVYFFLINIFFFILLFNFTGLIMYSYTLTSHILTTLFYTLVFFLSINFFLIINWFKSSFNLFFPSGVSLFISPLLIIIEIISYFGRAISLSVRLFANMLSGHALLKILIINFWGIFLGIFFKGLFLSFFIFFLVLLFILFLESAVAFLQGYVFSLMLILYYSDVLEFH